MNERIGCLTNLEPKVYCSHSRLLRECSRGNAALCSAAERVNNEAGIFSATTAFRGLWFIRQSRAGECVGPRARVEAQVVALARCAAPRPFTFIVAYSLARSVFYVALPSSVVLPVSLSAAAAKGLQQFEAGQQASSTSGQVGRPLARSLERPLSLPRILLLCQGRRSFYLSSSFLRWLVCRESENRLGPSASLPRSRSLSLSLFLSQVKCVECFLFLTTPSPPISLSLRPPPVSSSLPLSPLFCCTPRQLAVVFGRSQASPLREGGLGLLLLPLGGRVPSQPPPPPPTARIHSTERYEIGAAATAAAAAFLGASSRALFSSV